MNWNREEHKARTVFYYLGVVVLCLVIVFMMVDFINWREAISMIKQQIPIEAQYQLHDGGGGNPSYNPLKWRGDLTGEMWFFSDKDFNIQTRKIDWRADGNHIESIGRTTFHLPNSTAIIELPKDMEIHTTFFTSHKVNIFSHTYTRTEHTFDAWFYILDKGELTQQENLQSTIYRKNSILGIIYKIDDKTYIQIHKNAWWRRCKGGGFVWSFWRN
jgi:hypothetical protein